MGRRKENSFELIDRVAPCDCLMIVGKKRWQVAEGLIVAIYQAADELKSLAAMWIHVVDDGWGNALVLAEPVPPLFVESLLMAIPDVRVVPVMFADQPTRPLMTIGAHIVQIHGDPQLPGYVGPSADADRWDAYGDKWGSEWSARQYYDYRKRKRQASADSPH